MRNETILRLITSLAASAALASCNERADDLADPTDRGGDPLAEAVAAHRLRTWNEVRADVAVRYGVDRAAEIDRAVRGPDPVGWVPAEFLPVELPTGWIEVPERTFDQYAARALSPEVDLDGWLAAGLLDAHDRDQVERLADHLGVPAPVLEVAGTAAAPAPEPGCGGAFNCKVVLRLMVTKRETSNRNQGRTDWCRQYSNEREKTQWSGAVADFFATGGTIWRNNAFAPDFCLADTDSHETGKNEVVGTVVMTTEALDATRPKLCPADLVAGVNLWGEAHQTAELKCVAKDSGSYGFSFAGSTPWDCYAIGGVGCSVSGVGEQQLIATVEHTPDCTEKNSVSVNAKWSADKGWEVGGGAASETSCKKNLDAESRAALDCQIVRGPDVAWRSDANPLPTVQATIGGKTFRAKAKSLNSIRLSFWSAARRITAEAAAKTTANSAKVNIAASCSTNHPNDTGIACVVTGTRQDGY